MWVKCFRNRCREFFGRTRRRRRPFAVSIKSRFTRFSYLFFPLRYVFVSTIDCKTPRGAAVLFRHVPSKCGQSAVGSHRCSPALQPTNDPVELRARGTTAGAPCFRRPVNDLAHERSRPRTISPVPSVTRPAAAINLVGDVYSREPREK